jgi:predicted metal-dependent hydrolase
MRSNAQRCIAFKQRVSAWAKQLRSSPRQIVLMEMRNKWASCSSKGRICFAKDVLGLEPPIQDYIIVHELLHLKHPNHGRVFKSLLKATLPEWRTSHEQLRLVVPSRQFPVGVY